MIELKEGFHRRAGKDLIRKILDIGKTFSDDRKIGGGEPGAAAGLGVVGAVLLLCRLAGAT